MAVLTGPADPDAFRVKVGWRRMYTDPLPGCDIAPADDEDKIYPSISAVKKSRESDWSNVTVNRIAKAPREELHRIADLDPSERWSALNQLNKNGLAIDGGRGTVIHAWCEDLLEGRPMREITLLDLAEMRIPEAAVAVAELYKPALLDFFAAYRPKLLAKEYVVINRGQNGVGWGGTADVMVKMLDAIWLLDWKSRGPGSKHGAYADEGAQVVAPLLADYGVFGGPDGTAVRRRMPRPDQVKAGIVSVKPDGVRLYPVVIPEAINEWNDLHALYTKSLTPNKPIGRVLPVRRAAA